jgi:RHS repeat-associated protein
VSDENPSSLGAFEFALRLPGQYFDRETNLHYNYFRDYDASLGRYVQSDPIGLDGGLNTYAYAFTDPLAIVDPEGLRGGDVVKQVLVKVRDGCKWVFKWIRERVKKEEPQAKPAPTPERANECREAFLAC